MPADPYQLFCWFLLILFICACLWCSPLDGPGGTTPPDVLAV